MFKDSCKIRTELVVEAGSNLNRYHFRLVAIEFLLRLLQIEFSVVVIRFYAVVITPLDVRGGVLTAEGKLAPSDLAVLFQLYEVLK